MKILILTCKLGMGHYSAAKAIQQKLIDRYDAIGIDNIDLQDYYSPGPKKLAKDFWRELKKLKNILKFDDDKYDITEEEIFAENNNIKTKEVKIVDIFELAYPEIVDFIYKTYNTAVDKSAKLVNFIYNRLDDAPPTEIKFLEFIYNHMLGSVTKLLYKERPDLIISAFPVCSEVISEYKKLSTSDIPLFTVVTDIYPHATWISENTDQYLVAADETKKMLIESGVREDRIKIIGMPLSPKFENLKFTKENTQTEQINTKKIKKKKNKKSIDQIDLSRKRKLLIMGGGLGLVPTDLEFYEKLNNRIGVHTTVVTGKNETLYKKLHGKFENVEVLGFVNNIVELMSDSDLLLTKSGGITSFEAIYAGLPMAVFKPFLQQEIKNAEFIAEKNLGIVLPSKMKKINDDIKEVMQLLFDDERLTDMKNNMKSVVESIHEELLYELVDCVNSTNSGKRFFEKPL